MEDYSSFNCWFMDQEDANKSIYHRVKKQVFSAQTKFQAVEFLICNGLGEVLILDNKIQSAEFDEYIYHEALVHPAMLAHECPQRVLVLGGGEGATIREVLRYSSVSEVTMVDIDGELVELCKKHLNKWHQNSFYDDRCKIIYQDAWDYVKNTQKGFDVIISDISDPIEGGPATTIYTKDFYKIISRILNPGGLFVTQAVEVLYGKVEYHTQIYRTVSNVFPVAESYCDYIPSFSSVWGFVIGSKGCSAKQLTSNEITNRIRKRKVRNLRYYDGETHQRLFNLPLMVRKKIKKQRAIATLEKPIIVFS